MKLTTWDVLELRERAALEAKLTPAAGATPGLSTGEAGRGDGQGSSSRGQRGGRDFRGRGRGGRGRGRGRGGADMGSQTVASTASGPFALGSVTSGGLNFRTQSLAHIIHLPVVYRTEQSYQ